VEGGRDGCEEGGEGSGVVAGQSPECATGGDVASYAGDESWEESDHEEADGPGVGSCCLAIDCRQGEDGRRFEDGVEVLDGVEEGNEVEEGGSESNDELKEHCLWDVARRTVELLVKLRGSVDLKTYFGISSAR